MQKKLVIKLNETMGVDIVLAVGSFIMAKIIFYYLYELAEKGVNYLENKKNYKDAVNKVLENLAEPTIADQISKIINTKKSIDSTTVSSIIKIPFIKNQIEKVVKDSYDKINKSELENQLKDVFIKSWKDLKNNAIEKVKKDLK